MKSVFKALLVIGTWIVCAASAPAGAEGPMPSEFSADMLFSGPEGEAQGRMYLTADKIRFEMMGQVMITRLDRNVTWVLMPSENMYMEQPIDPKTVAQAGRDLPGEVERVAIGPEAVDGRPAVKYRVTGVSGGRAVSVYQWIEGAQPLPLRIQDIDGEWTVEYRNVRIGPQRAELFEPPAGMQKFAMPDFSQYAQMALENQGS